MTEQIVSTKQDSVLTGKTKLFVRLKQFERVFDLVASIFTVYGFIQALLIWQRLAGTSPAIVLTNTGITIQGVSWDWIVSTIVLLSARGVWGAIKSIARAFGNHED